MGRVMIATAMAASLLAARVVRAMIGPEAMGRLTLTSRLGLWLALLAGLLLFPIYWMVMSASMATSVILSRTPPLLPVLG